MSVKGIVARQYRDKVNQAARLLENFYLPPEGWLRTVRKALGMTGQQLASRLGVSKARVSRAEQDELTGSVTLKTMQGMAEALGCRFVYAVIPEQEVEEMIRQRALAIAREQVREASTQMALEAQALEEKQLASEVQRLADEMVNKLPPDFWNDP